MGRKPIAYWRWSVYVNFMDEISNTQFTETQTLSLSYFSARRLLSGIIALIYVYVMKIPAHDRVVCLKFVMEKIPQDFFIM